MADPSPSGLTRSLGLMVNYVYRLDELERNHEAYVRSGRVASSPWFLRGLRKRAGGQRA
jgi:malonyl-CoA decarboxylase